ncbi:hypothetical protein MPTK1_3g22770 [Marchantia polymorpha subsp. ruderalis]|uniref:Uncharacterized protein n=2 Tax=Marchantia polymorpha TaxID=3197 RepID=A0AAF6B3Q3_MARPO|nr:hypothetical protein MARPO_0024s0054 [Marchantia polymorpha]BBN06637.1 hypothetical protein Mp_3g22770 [Marchantia polymorpha subsp. ruderalis]|eukprot:PTQ43536.1 hypothetical protein MARPO_0024s0054 [Marchantia polymorpha]
MSTASIYQKTSTLNFTRANLCDLDKTTFDKHTVTEKLQTRCACYAQQMECSYFLAERIDHSDTEIHYISLQSETSSLFEGELIWQMSESRPLVAMAVDEAKQVASTSLYFVPLVLDLLLRIIHRASTEEAAELPHPQSLLSVALWAESKVKMLSRCHLYAAASCYESALIFAVDARRRCHVPESCHRATCHEPDVLDPVQIKKTSEDSQKSVDSTLELPV